MAQTTHESAGEDLKAQARGAAGDLQSEVKKTGETLGHEVSDLAQAARQMDANSVDSSLILFSMWTESIRHMAENGKGNVLFLDGSPEGMQKQMQDLMALQQLNVVQGTPAK